MRGAAALLTAAIAGIVTAAGSGSCSDSGELAATRTELAALQATLAAPTATPTATRTPTATPTPDVSELCERVFEYLYHRGKAIERSNQINEQRRYINFWTTADKREVEDLYRRAFAVFIPLPPPGAPASATVLRDKVMELRASDRRILDATWNGDADAHNRELPIVDRLHADVRAYWAELCLRR